MKSNRLDKVGSFGEVPEITNVVSEARRLSNFKDWHPYDIDIS